MRQFAIFVWFAASSVGCAFADAEVTPPTRPGPAVTAAHAQQREILVEGPFADFRGIKARRCGVKVNGLGIETADVDCTQDPGKWLAASLTAGLYSAGFKVLSPGATPGPSTLVVRGSIDQFYARPMVTSATTGAIEMEIGVKLIVAAPSGLVAERHFFVKGSRSTAIETDSEYQSAADDANDQFVRASVAAIDALVERYSAGSPSSALLAFSAVTR